jgi:hypothetical protein
MRSTTLFFLAIFAIFVIGTAHATDRQIKGFPELPKDARKVAERSIACTHFAGEVTGDKNQRGKEVNAQLRKLRCARIEQDMLAMRAKYQKHPNFLALLNEASNHQ